MYKYLKKWLARETRRMRRIASATASSRLQIAAWILVGWSVLGCAGCGTSLTPSTSLFSSASKTSTPIQKTDFLLNTFVDIKIYDSKDTSILDDAISICKDYEERFSRTIESGEIYQLNHRSADQQTFTLSDDTAELLSSALKYCELSNGAFDITIEPVSSLWDFSSGSCEIPDSMSISTALEHVGYDQLTLNDKILTFHSPETSMDLGAIAKGYIADRIRDHLISSGVKSAVINLGGNVLCVGSKPDGSPFKIGLQKPFAETSETFATIAVTDMSVVTSGVYERHFELDGVNYHHILNPVTGYPYDNGLISVTILSENSVDGDGLSTTCFSLGLEDGMKLIESLDGVYACFIDENYEIYYSDGMQEFIIK